MSSASASTSSLAASASASSAADAKNPAFKVVGICLAIGSGLFIGSSFVVKKKGLLRATAKYGNVAGEGHAYLKSWLWWTGMIMMVVGEVLNFVAYAFTEAILVTPMGALSVVVCAILSHFLLKESLTFFGWIGCILCILGATILALNAPEEQSVTTINAFKALFLSPGFLAWGSILIAISAFLAFWVGPRYGKKTMFVYISICSLIGGISVACTQGFGASIVSTIQGKDDAHKNWFFWVLFAFVVVTLLVEINYLNKALELFNASMVVPSYFCYFTSCVMISSFILYQGLKASAVTLITMVMGFLVTCLGITLLQMSKVDPEQLSNLDRKSTILLAASKHTTEGGEKGEVTALEEPGMDALRGGFGAVGSIIRARSLSRRASTMSRSLSRNYGDGMYDSNQNLSTHGLGHLQRYQLSDTPLPSDAMDKISLHSAKSPISPSHATFPFPVPNPKRSKSHLKFEEADVVHQYGYGRDNAMHSVRPHPPPIVSRGLSAFRQGSYPPVREEGEDEDDYHGGPGIDDERSPISPASTDAQHAHIQIAQAYLNPYQQPPVPNMSKSGPSQPQSHPQGKSNPSPISPGLRSGVSGLFNFGSGPDLALGPGQVRKGSGGNDKEVRGGAHRGTKDYPHRPKGEEETEHEERRGLVEDDGEEAEEEMDVGYGQQLRVMDYGQGGEPRAGVGAGGAMSESPASSQAPSAAAGGGGRVRRLPVIPGRGGGGGEESLR